MRFLGQQSYLFVFLQFLLVCSIVSLSYAQANEYDIGLPDCVLKCWDNSKLVSNCKNEKKCLCRDYEYQSMVYRCLYSQCHTAQFGPALHHTLVECSQYEPRGLKKLPLLLHGQTSRRHAKRKSGHYSDLGPAYQTGFPSVGGSLYTSAPNFYTPSRRPTGLPKPNQSRATPTLPFPNVPVHKITPPGSPTATVVSMQNSVLV